MQLEEAASREERSETTHGSLCEKANACKSLAIPKYSQPRIEDQAFCLNPLENVQSLMHTAEDSKRDDLGSWILIVVGDGVVGWVAVQILLEVHHACAERGCLERNAFLQVQRLSAVFGDEE